MSKARIKAVIIDDERPARELIETLLQEYEEIEVVGECADGRQAVKTIEALKPDLIFLDIKMPLLDGFGVLQKLNGVAPPVVIFVTAYDQYAVRAFEVHALDYLLKPIRRQRFADAISRAREQLQQSGDKQGGKLRALLQHWDKDGKKGSPLTQSEYLQRIFVKERRKSLSIEIDEVDWIASLDHFVEIHSRGRTHILHEKLSLLEQKLDPTKFFRIHRTRIVNLASIKEFNINEIGGYFAVMSDGTSHRVARSRCRGLQRLLAGS